MKTSSKSKPESHLWCLAGVAQTFVLVYAPTGWYFVAMHFRRLAAFSAFLAVSFTLLAGGEAQAQRIEKYDRVFFSNIAPGELENEFIRNFPTKIMLQSESGKIYGGVFVRIFNASGIAVFKKMCEKPWLFVKLPEGDYNVVGVDRNKLTRAKAFHVGKEGSKQSKVKLSWPKKVVGY